MSRALLVLAGVALIGCHTVHDYEINDVVSLHALPSSGVEACATYQHEDDAPFADCCDIRTAFRLIRIDAHGGLTDTNDACSGAVMPVSEMRFSDGRRLEFADSSLTLEDAGGAMVWTVPSPFGTSSAASDAVDDHVFIGRGPQVARIALADGSAEWISELR